MAQLDFESEMTAHWLQSGIGPRQAVAKLQPACVGVDPPSEEVIQELEAKWQQGLGAFDIVLDILGGLWNRLAGFDCEDVGWPADHTHVVIWPRLPGTDLQLMMWRKQKSRTTN